MSSRRRTPPAAASTYAVKRALLAGVALAVVWPAVAAAQPVPSPLDPGGIPLIPGIQRGQVLNDLGTRPVTPKAAPAHVDGLKPGELYMEADQIVRDDKNGLTTAEGHVEIRYEDRTLRADRVVYKEPPPPPEGQTRSRDRNAPAQGVIRAYGHVQVIHDDGQVEFADQMTVDDKMQAAIAIGFSARLKDKHTNQDVLIAGATAARRSEDIQELNKAIYTPCPVCVGDVPKDPTWSITADRVIQDNVHHMIYYRHAKVRIMGLPVIYLPVLWHADPSVDRMSGLLAPRIGVSSRRGFSYEQPYLHVFSPSEDIIISPQINTKVHPFVNALYRRRFDNGDLDVRVGYTHDYDRDNQGQPFGEDTNRSYILAHGAWHIDEKWTVGFTAERTSDPLLFDKYDIGRVYQARGPYVPDDRRLISQAYAIRQDEFSYASVATFSIQGLRSTDNNRTIPVIPALVDSMFEDPNDFLGGRLRWNVSAVAINRSQSPEDQAANLPGLDSRRVTSGLDWRRYFTSSGGLRVEPFIDLRLDGYSVNDILTGVGKEVTSKTEARAMAVAGADISYPFYRRWRDSTVVLEPMAQIAVSPNVQQVTVGTDATGKPVYLNEDSVAFEFDESTLFQANKFPGYDLYEDGVRLNIAGRGTILWDDGRRASLLIGRSLRTEPNTVFSPASGLSGRESDWILSADAQPLKGLSFFVRTRLDSDNLEVHRIEAGLNVNNKWGSGYLRYLSDDQGINGTPVKNFDVGGDLNLTKHWGLLAFGNRDLLQNAWVVRDIGAFYKDECIRVDVFYRHEDVIVGRVGASDQLSIRLTLATLGAPLYGH